MKEWMYFFFFCLVMNSLCIQGFGNIVHVPFMPIMHTRIKMKKKKHTVCEVYREMESCHVQSRRGINVQQRSTQVESSCYGMGGWGVCEFVQIELTTLL